MRHATGEASKLTKRRTLTGATLKKWVRLFLSYVAVIAIVIIMVSPIAWLMLSAFKGEAEIVAYPPTFWPREWKLVGFHRLFAETSYLTWFKNTARG